MIVICFDTGKVVQRIEVAGSKRNCGFKLVLRFSRPVCGGENAAQFVVRRDILGIFREKMTILLLSIGIAAVLELKVSNVVTCVGIFGIDRESFLVFSQRLLPVPFPVECGTECGDCSHIIWHTR